LHDVRFQRHAGFEWLVLAVGCYLLLCESDFDAVQGFIAVKALQALLGIAEYGAGEVGG